jgi:hypothetical protein
MSVPTRSRLGRLAIALGVLSVWLTVVAVIVVATRWRAAADVFTLVVLAGSLALAVVLGWWVARRGANPAKRGEKWLLLVTSVTSALSALLVVSAERMTVMCYAPKPNRADLDRAQRELMLELVRGTEVPPEVVDAAREYMERLPGP